MKKLVTIITLILLLVTTIVPQIGCKGEIEETEPVPSESNRWLELLSVLPENEDTLKSAYIQTKEYVDILREQLQSSQDAPAGALDSVELSVHRCLPLFESTSYTDQEWKETVGFTVKDVNESVVASGGPPVYYQAVRGNFGKEDLENAARTGPLNEHMEVESYSGYEFYSWGEDFDIHMDWRSGVRRLGRGHRLAYVDGFAIWMLWTDGLKEMIDAYEGNIPSLADNEDYKLLAGALEDMGTVTAFFSSDSVSISEFKDMFRDNFEELRQKGQEQQVTEFENEPLLKPYLSFATGASEDEQGTYLVIVLANPDESTARANVELLEQRINESLMLPYIEGDRKWTDGGHIESMEINSNGRLTMAKLYGPVYTNWDDFALISGVYMPLLLHE
jgi:hypothetical protein